MRNTVLLIFVLFLLAIGLGYIKYRFMGQSITLGEEIQATPEPSPEPTQVSDSAVDLIIQKLSPRQKVVQLVAYPITVPSSVSASSSAQVASNSASILSSSSKKFLTQNTPGFITLYGSKISTISAQKAIQEVKTFTTNVEPSFAVDHEGDVVQRLSGKGFTRLPAWKDWCESIDVGKNASVRASAKELREVGITMVFGPVVDVASSSSFLKDRLCSEDPDIVVQHTEIWGNIFAQEGITPIIKHYPGIGTATKDLHLGFTPINPSLTEQRIFGKILSHFPTWGVMVSHGGIEDPCSLDTNCIQPLRQEFPQTLLFTDGLEMKAVQTQPTEDLGVLSIQAIQAGNDVLVFGTGISPVEFDGIINTLVDEYESNPTFKMHVEDRLKRILEYKEKV
jgi:beta-N-acetylhexosaminidase